MTERKPCLRCERAIDSWSKICPFCNWDQNDLAPPPMVRHEAAPAGNPEDEVRELIKKKGAYVLGGVLILILSFLVGMVINSDDAVEEAPETLAEQVEKQNLPPARRAETPLVPTNERGGIEQPITSAPVAASPDGMSDGYDRSDATAVSSAEYNQLARRAQAEKERMDMLVDPRTISGAAYAQGQRARRTIEQIAQTALPGSESQVVHPAPRPRRALRTRPVPQYQPIPRLPASGTARLSLIIGPDGTVRDINIERPLDRNTADLVAAVQRWRFKPATEDGDPVSAPYSVDISFGDQ